MVRTTLWNWYYDYYFVIILFFWMTPWGLKDVKSIREGFSTKDSTWKPQLSVAYSEWITCYYHACMLSFFSRVWLFAMLWTVAHQSSLSIGSSRQEVGFSFLLQTLPDPGIRFGPACISCPAGGFFTHWATWEARRISKSRSEIRNT